MWVIDNPENTDTVVVTCKWESGGKKTSKLQTNCGPKNNLVDKKKTFLNHSFKNKIIKKHIFDSARKSRLGGLRW